MKHIERNNDVVLNQNDLEDLHTFTQFPVYMGCTNNDPSEDILFDMSWKISKSSGMIQLNPLLPLDIVYNAEHGSGTIGKLWDEHHEMFCNFVQKYNPKSILEIGGLHGYLAKKYLDQNPNTNWTIIEPNPIVDPSIPVKVITGFFDNDFKSDEKYDAVIHSHVLEHVYNPDEFINHKSSFMEENDLLLFSVPNMEVMLKNKYTNCINFEHTIFISEPYIEYFLNKHKFEIIGKEYFKDNHSIFYCAKKTQTNIPSNLPNDLYNKYKVMFTDYINKYVEDVQNLNKIINNTTLPVYVFGAHVFTQYLINFGLDVTKIINLLDNDVKKENKRLYGTNLISKLPKVLKDVPEALVVLRAGVYNEEVKQDILSNINPNITFI
jgi:hypothetical protein